MSDVLVLDFDGVICDSIDECLITTYNSYQIIAGTSHHVKSISDIDQTIVKRFRKLRYHVGPVGEYWIIFKWILNSEEDLNLDSFQNLKTLSIDEMRIFEKIFFLEREKIQNDLSYWVGLHSMYPEFSKYWESLKEKFTVYIVTTKDLRSVEVLLDHYKIDIKQNMLWTKEKNISKKKAIEEIIELEHCLPSNVHFLDDNIVYLQQASVLGIKCYLAQWGYISGMEIDQTFFKPIDKASLILP